MIPPKMSTDAAIPDGNLVSTEKTVDNVPETENLVTSTSTTAASGKAQNLRLFVIASYRWFILITLMILLSSDSLLLQI